MNATRARIKDEDVRDRLLPYAVFSCLRLGSLDLGS